ncbi:SDR family NAD(P)-dependent oxidoreductase [Chloroflexia bacterium SDU3-3]|nr:SDR family NAD(P)-dependent oxidoreductase [Chloroflexia bacterium SDU3-3]
MQIEGSVALVTGANRGIGAAYVQALLAAGAAKVYAAARNPQALAELAAQDARVVPVALDVASDESVQAAAQALGDVTLLINNAGVGHNADILAAADLSAARSELEVNYFGVLRMARAFAPTLAKNGGGALVNVLSILSLVAAPGMASYSASKAAAFSLTQSIRAKLRAQGTLVVGVMPGFVDTDMIRSIQAAKIAPADVAEATLQAIRSGEEDVFPGEQAAGVAQWLRQDPKAVERSFAG